MLRAGRPRANLHLRSFMLDLDSLLILTLLGLGLIKINTVLANFNNPRLSLILNN